MSDNSVQFKELQRDSSGWVRRTDVTLRTLYPTLVTRIFETTPNNFVIWFDKATVDASKVDFDAFRPATLSARLSNDVPASFVREIQTLSDSELAHNYEGFPFNKTQLLNLLIGRFPEIPIMNVQDGGTPMTVTVELTEAISSDDEERLLTFCKGIRVPAPFRIVIVPELERDTAADTIHFPAGDAMYVGASRLRASAPSFVRADEAFWFDNLDRIFAGRLGVEGFPGLTEGEARCFVDASVGEHINLRQLLTFYDAIYLSPPLREGFREFLQKQALTEEDILKLVEIGRLKIISTQAEERLNIRFLEKVTERSPFAILGRRTTAAMLIADLVETANEYRLADPTVHAALGELSQMLAQSGGLPADRMLQLVLWPIQARRAALWPLLERGTKGIPIISLGPFVSELIQNIGKRDLEFESLVISEKVHVGHALRATVFAARHEEGLQPLGNMIGETLNFFRSFNTRIAAAWVGNVERKQAGKMLVPPLPLLEFDRDIPIEEILASTDRPVMRNRGRALFSRLADMTEEERLAEVRDLQKALRNYGRPKGIISFDTADTGVSLASVAFNFTYPPIPGLAAFGKQLIEVARRKPEIDKMVEAILVDIFPDGGRDRELDFLSKINRVAVLKTSRVS